MLNEETLWQKCPTPAIPKRTVDGKWIVGAGQTWRRKKSDGKWEYRQDEETIEHWIDRQF